MFVLLDLYKERRDRAGKGKKKPKELLVKGREKAIQVS